MSLVTSTGSGAHLRKSARGGITNWLVAEADFVQY